MGGVGGRSCDKQQHCSLKVGLMCVNWSTLVVTNFVYMCRSVDVELSSEAILQYTRVAIGRWTCCQQAELDSI